jgi:hypothetical protein
MRRLVSPRRFGTKRFVGIFFVTRSGDGRR